MMEIKGLIKIKYKNGDEHSVMCVRKYISRRDGDLLIAALYPDGSVRHGEMKNIESIEEGKK